VAESATVYGRHGSRSHLVHFTGLQLCKDARLRECAGCLCCFPPRAGCWLVSEGCPKVSPSAPPTCECGYLTKRGQPVSADVFISGRSSTCRSTAAFGIVGHAAQQKGGYTCVLCLGLVPATSALSWEWGELDIAPARELLPSTDKFSMAWWMLASSLVMLLCCTGAFTIAVVVTTRGTNYLTG